MIGLVILLLLVSRATWGLYWKAQLAKKNLRDSTERVAKLEERQIILQEKIERLKTPRGIEEEIRNNYPVVKEGEQVINIVETEDQVGTTTAPPEKHWWQIF